MCKISIILLVVASLSALFYPLMVGNPKPLPVRLELATIQGNSLIANYTPFVSEPIISYATILGKNVKCPIELQCVSILKDKGFKIQGNAQDIIPNSFSACLYCGILLYSGRYGHVAYIQELYSDYIVVLEKNYLGCGITSTRSIQLDDPDIRGYLKP